MGYLSMFTSIFKYSFITQKRYLFDVVVGLASMLLILIFIQMGIHSFEGHISGEIMENRLSVLIVGFFTFLVITNAISIVSYSIVEGSKAGTLEQAMLSPYGAEGVYLSVAISRSLIHLIMTLLIIPFSMLVCRHWFYVDMFKMIVLIVPLWLCCWGVGFAMGATALVFKRVQSVLNLTQFLVLSMLVIQSYPFNSFSLLPISPEAVTLYRTIGLQQSISLSWIAYLYMHGLTYLIVGILIFKGGEHYAKEKGILGQY